MPAFIPISPPKDPKECAPWLYEVLRRLNTAVGAQGDNLSAVSRGELPDGSGTPLSGVLNLDDYLYLPGRRGGQVVKALLNDPRPTLSLLSTDIGVAAQRWQAPATVTVTDAVSNGTTTVTSASVGFGSVAVGMLISGSLVPVGTTVATRPTGSTITTSVAIPSGTSTMTFSHITDLGYVTNSSARDVRLLTSSNLQLITSGASAGGQASGLRLAVQTAIGSTVRSFLQVGPTNLNLALCGFNGADGASLHSLFTYVTFNTWSGSALTNATRVGVNVDPFDYSGSATSAQSSGMHIRPVSNSTTNPAALVIEQQIAAQPMIELRTTSAGSAPTRTIGSLQWQIDSDGDMKWYSAGSRRGRLQPIVGGTGTGGFTWLNNSDRLQFETLPEVGAFADSVTSLYLRIANTSNEVNRLMLCSAGSAAFSRLGIIATSTILGPAPTGLMPAPVSSRILTLVNSSGTVLSGFTSAGAHFHVSGASSGFVWTSDANGVGSWQAGSGGLDPTADETVTGTWTFDGSGSILGVESVVLTGDGTYVPMTVVNAANNIGVPYAFLLAVNTALTDVVALGLDGAPSGTTSLLFPAAGGTVVTTTATQSMANKTLTVANTFQSTTASIGASFSDSTTSTKRLRIVLSGAVGNNSITITNSAARNWGLGNLSGSLMVVGDDAPAVASGSLGKVDLTGQTAGIGSTNLSSTPPAGLYAVEVYAACTTASGSGSPTLTVTLGWTDVIGATTLAATGLNATTFPLPLSTTGRAHATFIIQVASGDISYSTTINAPSGSPQYAIYIRVVALT